jgi:histidinol-phosphate aminotransferase
VSGSILSRARPDLLALAGYSSARMEATGGALWLNANESPWPSPVDAGMDLNRYPDPQPAGLRGRFAEWLGVPAENLLIGRGSDEAIDLLTRAFCRAGVDAVVTSPPTFGMYQVSASIQGARVVEMPLDAANGYAWPLDGIQSAIDDSTKLVWVCTPNNPTGTAVPRNAILDLARRLDGRALVVVDEAYAEFGDAESLAPAAARPGNLAVLRTLSKAHALAGARVGGVVADADVIALLRRLMAPYPLPTPSVAAAEAALAPATLAVTASRIALVRAERRRMAGALATIPGVREVLPSQANFLTVRLDDAPRTYATLLARGIVVRDVSRHASLAGCLRITIGTPDENDRVLAALAEQARAAA